MAGEQDITEHLHRYRECCRGLWNNFLRAPDFERAGAFDEICAVLFDELVVRYTGRQYHPRRLGPEPISFLRVVPLADSTPIMIRHLRSTAGNNYWDDPVGTVPAAATMTFIECFDWDVLASIDMQYVRVRIEDFPSHPELAGRDALIEAHYVSLRAVPASGAEHEERDPA